MSRSNGSDGDYELLDDHIEDIENREDGNVTQRLAMDDVSCIHRDEDDDNQSKNPRTRILNTIRQIKLPSINFRYIRYRYKSLSDRQQACLSVGLCLFLLVAVHVKCLLLGWYTVFRYQPAPVIDKSYTAFQIPYHQASLHFKAFQTAEKNHTPFVLAHLSGLQHSTGGSKQSMQRSVPLHGSDIIGGKRGGPYDSGHGVRKKRSSYGSYYGNSLVEVPYQWHPQWKMQVIFLVKEGENIFTKEKLQKIHMVEKQIMKHENFSDFCFKDVQSVIKNDPAIRTVNGCSPLNSLMTYFFPSRDGAGNVFYDGLGENMDNIDSALKLAMTSTKFYYYVDDKTNSSNRKSQLLRTEVLFGAPLKGNEYVRCWEVYTVVSPYVKLQGTSIM